MFTGHGWLAGWNRGVKLGDRKGIIICGNGEKRSYYVFFVCKYLVMGKGLQHPVSQIMVVI